MFMTAETTKISMPTFLSDHASSEDFFGSHERVADAIVSVIEHSKQTRVIGILGPWGSGKSTIIRLIENKLSQKHPTEKTCYFFSYDAWLHQNDPPRRSFLESLIRFLVAQKITTADRWSGDLDRLNRRVEDNDITTTPTLTLPGKLIAASLIITAYGWKLADSAHATKFLGLTVAEIGYALISAPVWAGLIAYGWLRITKNEDHASVFSMFVNKATERVKTRIIRTPDPTAIEFQEVFKRIMATVARGDRAFVFVIDNLDRISEAEAIAIWSTIRSFFVDELRGYDNNSTATAPIVLLPLDPGAIHRMYGKGNDEAEELAKSFIDKTFDLVFRVSPPVQSGWQGYLAKKLREAFADISEHEIFVAEKLYELWTLKTSNGVTPRNINLVVNELATLRMQWRTEIPFATLAYYAIYKSEIEKHIDEYLNTEPYVSQFDARWPEGIAAIHYGVPTDSVLQVLLSPKIQGALEAVDQDAFKKLSAAVGFESVLQKTIEDQLAAKPYPPEIAANAAGLLASAKLKATPRLTEVENTLRRAFSSPQKWKRMSPLTAPGIAALFESCHDRDIITFAAEVDASLEQVEPTFLAEPKSDERWRDCAIVSIQASFDSRKNDDTIVVPGDALFFLKVLDLIDIDAKSLIYLRTGGPESVIQQISNEASAVGFKTSPESRIRKLSEIPTAWDWIPLIEAAGQHLQNPSRPAHGDGFALDALGLLRKLNLSKAANAKLKQLSETAFFDVLYNAHQQKAYETEASLLALFMLVNPTFEMTSIVGNGESGRQLVNDLTGTLSDRPDVNEIIDRKLARFGSFKQLISAATKNSDIGKLAKAIFAKRLRESNLGPLHVDDVIEKFDVYCLFLEEAEQGAFVNELPHYPAFWETIDKSELTDNLCAILRRLISNRSEIGQRARAIVMKKTQAFDEARWKEVLAKGIEPMPTVLDVIPLASKDQRFGESLLQALRASFDSALGVEKTSRLQDWFKLANMLDENRSNFLMKDIKDRILSHSSNIGMLEVLKAGGAALLSRGDFKSRADDAARNIVVPLIDKFGDSEAWFEENKSEIRGWIEKADKSTKEYLADKLSNLPESETSDHITAVAKEIGITLPNRRKAMKSPEDKEESSTR
jgi:GTPase SAR1 family protein